MSDAIILSAKHLAKSYQEGKLQTSVLADVNLEIKQGELCAIMGASGAGKSTLLHILGGLDQPTNGEVIIDGVNLTQASEAKKDQLRNEKLGFVYQFHHLLKEFNVLDNVALRLLVRGEAPKVAREQAADLLEKVGLKDRMSHGVSQISGGERQRVAIARALIGNPVCVLADEPTGNLDLNTATTIFDLMLQLNETLNTSFVLVTHNQELAKQAGRVLMLEGGKIG